jgi:hypothetical protein
VRGRAVATRAPVHGRDRGLRWPVALACAGRGDGRVHETRRIGLPRMAEPETEEREHSGTACHDARARRAKPAGPDHTRARARGAPHVALARRRERPRNIYEFTTTYI